VPVITNSRRQHGSARRAGAAAVDVIKTTPKHAGGKARGIPIPVRAAIVTGVTSLLAAASSVATAQDTCNMLDTATVG
jgi:hypothetical protein